MERISRVVDLPEIESKRLFSQVIDFEVNLVKDFSNGEFIPPSGITDKEYLDRLYKEYVKLFLSRAEIIKRRHNK